MPGRRRLARCIGFDPRIICFKPCGRPGRGLETVALRADELEALRLSDLEGLYQEECARRMHISRTTLSRTLTAAHRKVADALIHGKRLVIAQSPEDFGADLGSDQGAKDLEVSVGTRGQAVRTAAVPEDATAYRPTDGTPIDRITGRGPVDDPTREERTMKKIVLTANDDRGLEGEMAMHFGHCAYFVVAQVNGENQVELAEVQVNPYAQGHQPGQIPQYIKSLGADVVIAGGMGAKAIEWFQQLGIEVSTGTRQGVGATLDAYIAGAVTGATECDHDH